MTVVGDIAQTGDLCGARPGRRSSPYVADRWRLAELTVNYRTPAEIMALAATVLAAHRPGPATADLGPVDRQSTAGGPASPTGPVAWARRSDAVWTACRSRRPARRDRAGRGGGDADPRRARGARGDARRGPPISPRPVVVLTVRQAKGLEFDSVVVVDPAAHRGRVRRGPSDLYVALTRATQRLTRRPRTRPRAALTAASDRAIVTGNACELAGS